MKNRKQSSDDEWEEEPTKSGAQPYLGTRRDLGPDEELEVDASAYRMLWRANAEWPCLSFDFVEGGGSGRPQYPIDVSVIAASQAERSDANALYALRFAGVGVTQFDDDEAPPEDSFEETEPVLLGLQIPLRATTNRVRMLRSAGVAALMSESNELILVDLRASLPTLEGLSRDSVGLVPALAPMQTLPLGDEGFALGWALLREGELAAGTVNGEMRVFAPSSAAGPWKAVRQWQAHSAAVEEIAFSPTDANALATCSADQHVIVHDLRTAQPALRLHAHSSDVNALSWNARATTLLATGAEDGSVRVWDLRQPMRAALSNIAWHTAPIVSVCWAPHDEWTMAVGAGDDRVSIWDLSVEPDTAVPTPVDVPDQLLFLHQGMEELREVGWHPTLHNVLFCTAASGFHLFEPALDDALSVDSN